MNLIQSAIRLLHFAVKSSIVNFENIRVGDRIVITNVEDDVDGTVQELKLDNIRLLTSSGVKNIKYSKNNIIHIIKRADMLNLRNHNEYERDLKDMTKEDHQNKGRPEYGPEEKTEKSKFFSYFKPFDRIAYGIRAFIDDCYVLNLVFFDEFNQLTKFPSISNNMVSLACISVVDA